MENPWQNLKPNNGKYIADIEIDSVILERIKRKIEPNMDIVPQTTPIIYFGNYDTAKACTISLNPSNLEFVDRAKKLLDDKNKERLCSRKKLKRADNEELSDDEAKEVLRYCKNYFNDEYNPYNQWFKPFDHLIKRYCNYSYYDGTCVHLDLVQWATSEKWAKVHASIREKHLSSDLRILEHLLKKNFEVMFLNGRTVVDNTRKRLGINLEEKSMRFKNKPLVIYYGEYNKIKVIGWNIYLQSAAGGGYEDKNRLCDLIKQNL